MTTLIGSICSLLMCDSDKLIIIKIGQELKTISLQLQNCKKSLNGRRSHRTHVRVDLLQFKVIDMAYMNWRLRPIDWSELGGSDKPITY
ncbi:hypothetical protein MJO28_012908 [Puccinia striiformis f. sp. tritici]|uniref:Uncharacterized protein n=1 Tax=Puccinia striiformis f. sp. tritici TaxID=168172 RepID=A0ACC0DWR1_9BASI|nr:hypothetical protein MJO28_012908 [Puccinia striiformis f. sp. tritici]